MRCGTEANPVQRIVPTTEVMIDGTQVIDQRTGGTS